jgi:carboxyl-terminal processing protease
VRDEVKLEDQQAKARIVDWPQKNGVALRLGVIDLPSFYGGFDEQTDTTPSSATADVAKLIRKLEAEHIQGLVLDLRQNGGGSLEEAITSPVCSSVKGRSCRPANRMDARTSERTRMIRSFTMDR